MGSHSRHTIKNIQFKFVTAILFEIAVCYFLWFKLFRFCFENSIYLMMMITQTRKISENFEFVISKSMHKPPSPLKPVFCFIIL